MALTLTPNGVHHIVTVVAVHARQTRSVDSTSQLCAAIPIGWIPLGQVR